MKNFINIADINKQDLRKIIDLAKERKKKDIKLSKHLNGKTLIMIFEKKSLRTRISFESSTNKCPPNCFIANSKDNLVLVDAFSKSIINVLSINGLSGSWADLLILDLFFFCDLACSIIFLKSCLLISAIFIKFFILN